VIGRALGDVRAARAVASWITEHPETPQSHRVVRADGRPVVPGAERTLAREGLQFPGGRVDSNRFVESLKAVDFLGARREEQRELGRRVMEEDLRGPTKLVAGVDLAYLGDEAYAVAVSVALPDLDPVEIAAVRRRVNFPYIPTYLAYRESPGIEEAVRRLRKRPDVLLVDGHGRLHPTLFGVACAVGVHLDLPTIGVAKHPLYGHVQGARERNMDARPIRIDGVARGYAWVPPGRGRAIYVSVGHRVSLADGLALVRRSTRHGYPEPLRIADRIAREMKRNQKGERGATR
jgi:deoxyribonuclease V